MKSMIVGCLLFLLVSPALADEYPQYFESVEPKSYSLIIFMSADHAIYLNRFTRPEDGTIWFFYDPNATWGRYPDSTPKREAIWIKTSKFRFDYFLELDTLVEFDKMGKQGTYHRVINDAELGGKDIR